MANLQMLASDDNNPDFVGAHNPDSRLWARFYTRPRLMRLKSEQEQRPQYQDVTYVEIRSPGDALNIINRPALESDKARFPMQWAHYKNTQGGDAATIGTPVSQWPRMTPSMVEMLKAMKFMTVESIAMASDQQLSSIGMMGGMAPMSLREAAKTYLQVAKDSGYAQQMAEQRKKDQEELADLRKQMAEMKDMLAQATAPAAKPEKAKA